MADARHGPRKIAHRGQDVRLAGIGQPLILALPKADHGLDNDGDIEGSIGNVKATMYKMKRFLDEMMRIADRLAAVALPPSGVDRRAFHWPKRAFLR